MSAARLLLSLIAGASAALIAFSLFYTRGDTGGIFRFLGERGAARRLEAAGASPEQVAAAKARALEIAQGFADPAFATQMLPAALLIGVVVAALVWTLFGRRLTRAEQGGERADVQERMVLKLAYRSGGHFTLRDLEEKSPLTSQQAREVTARMLERGQLTRDGEGYRLS
ncbi:MAG: hypothetical protein Q4C89_06505 [Deinococcus sp.]|uniref:hypothetical protein n=1 Tax=Deinococcus sp. TaxID=47478 RepID=UPI0026DB4625|nr:hypothetical protein [Deinococcus sp.]MDO4245655.1 hypothetical protein [Deinococcus sp.]